MDMAWMNYYIKSYLWDAVFIHAFNGDLNWQFPSNYYIPYETMDVNAGREISYMYIYMKSSSVVWRWYWFCSNTMNDIIPTIVATGIAHFTNRI